MTKALFAILFIALMVVSEGSTIKKVQAKELSTEERHAFGGPTPNSSGHKPFNSSPIISEEPEEEEEEEEPQLHKESESEYSEIVAHHAQRKNHFASHYAEAAAATPATPAAKATTAFGQTLIGAVLALVL